jgi:hypothetical protein
MPLFVRRSLRVYLFHLAWLAVTAGSFLMNHSTFGRSTLAFMFVIGLTSFIYKLMKKNYLEATEGVLVIHSGIFRIRKIEVSLIDQVVINTSPSSISKIKLKDGTEADLEDDEVKWNDLKSFFGQLKIPVE